MIDNKNKYSPILNGKTAFENYKEYKKTIFISYQDKREIEEELTNIIKSAVDSITQAL